MTFVGEQGPEPSMSFMSGPVVPLPVRDETWRRLKCTCRPNQPEMTYTPGCPRCEGWSQWMSTTFADRDADPRDPAD